MVNGTSVTGKILIVDDVPISLGLMRDQLENAGFNVLAVSSGEEALARVEEIKPDLILLDVLMPGLDGFETCRRLKENEATQDIPIIFMTVLSETADRLMGFEVGAVDYIAKSAPLDEILARVRIHLTLRQTQQALLAANEQLQQANQELAREITNRNRAKELLQQRNRELALISRAVQMFNSTFDLNQILHTILDEIHRLLDITGTSFWLCLPDTGELICQHATGPGSNQVIGWRLAPGQGLAGYAAQTGGALLVSNTRAEARHFKEVDQKIGLETRSILTIPLTTPNGVIGVLNVVDTRVGRFTKNDLQLLEPIIAVATLVIENARLFDETRQARMAAGVAPEATE
ncbi:MAG: response regulator [Anaerolineae bacterium]|nr:response regulator [Anaerolineae bacterium]